MTAVVAGERYTLADEPIARMFTAFVDMRRQRDQAFDDCHDLRQQCNEARDERDRARSTAVELEQRWTDAELRIANALALVDFKLTRTPDECVCGGGLRCLTHRLEDALRGVER